MYRVQKKIFFLVITLLICCACFVIFFALRAGIVTIESQEIFSILTHSLGTDGQYEHHQIDPTHASIILNIRLKRIVAAFIVGAALSLSGCVFQALLRNPLADPHILGVSSGGALGAVCAALCGVPFGYWGVTYAPFFSFLGSLGAIYIVYTIARRKGVLSLYTLLLVGVVLNSFFISLVIFIESIMSSDQLASIFFWLLGSLSLSDERVIGVLAASTGVGFFILMRYARAINLFALGEEEAHHMGVPVEWTKRLCFLTAALMTGMCVSVSGLIGFVGLIVPHCARLMFGSDHRIVIPTSALMGGIFLIISDTLARTLIAPQELPVGVITSFLGAPFFVFLLKRKEAGRIF